MVDNSFSSIGSNSLKKDGCCRNISTIEQRIPDSIKLIFFSSEIKYSEMFLMKFAKLDDGSMFSTSSIRIRILSILLRMELIKIYES